MLSVCFWLVLVAIIISSVLFVIGMLADKGTKFVSCTGVATCVFLVIGALLAILDELAKEYGLSSNIIVSCMIIVILTAVLILVLEGSHRGS